MRAKTLFRSYAMSAAGAGLLFGDARSALARLERPPDFGRCDPRIGPGHQQVIEHVGAFSDQAHPVAFDDLDAGLDRFFAELLGDRAFALAQQLGGVGARWVGAAPRRDHGKQPIKGGAVNVAHGVPRNSRPISDRFRLDCKPRRAVSAALSVLTVAGLRYIVRYVLR